MKILYFTVFTVFLLFHKSQAQSIVINELMASNSSAYADETGSYEDWFELYNVGSADVDLGGYFISDDAGNLKKYQLPSGTGKYIIKPGKLLILWASGIPSRGPMHIGFSLGADGEQLLLVAPNETIIDQIDFPKQRTDISYGRKTNGSPEIVYFSPSSPNANNVAANSYTGVSEAPSLSVESGFFQNSFSLSISTNEPGAEIYYTTDGSEPTKDNIVAPGKSYQYVNQYPENPNQSTGSAMTKNYLTFKQASPVNITISDKSEQPDVYASISTTNNYIPTYNSVPVKPVYKGTVIRAKVFASDKLPSETISRTYLFTPDGQPKSSLPLFSIKTSPDNLFDFTKGISVAGKDFVDWRNQNLGSSSFGIPVGNYYRNTEIPVNIEVLIGGSPVINQEVGLRIHGAGSRTSDKKSFRLYSTGDNASESSIDYQLFPSLPFHSFKRLLLRNSGNDYEKTLFKDAFIHQIGKNLNIEVMDYRPAVTFINGEYWGIHNIRERLDEYYFASHYGLDADNIEFFADPEIVNNSGQYANISNYVKTKDLTDSTNYNYVKDRLDLDNFIDYTVLELYAANWDWPYGNVMYWRNKVDYNPAAGNGKDGRWRWALFDVDLSFEEFDANQFSKALGAPDFLLSYLLKNMTFRNKFINRYADLINSHFQPQKLIDQINICKNAIVNEIPENIKRWNRPADLTKWESNINLLINFAKERPKIARNHIIDQFKLPKETILVKVDVSNTDQGYVKVNTIDILPETPGLNANPYPWQGTYFQSVEIKLTAMPKSGFKFVRWENKITAEILTTATIPVNSSSNSDYRAVFAPDAPAAMIPAPLDPSVCTYNFTQWSATAAAGTFPANMAFVYMENDDPGVNSPVAGFTSGAYNLTSRTRINGLGDNGISFINTGSAEGNPGYPGMKLGGAILALNTTGKISVSVKWITGTVTPNSRPYALRLQYRLSDTGDFTDVLNGNHQPVEYVRNATAGHQQLMDWVKLPAAALNQPYVQLLWRYYNTDAGSGGARAELRLDEIQVETCANPLPVSLVRFDAVPVENQVMLNWETTEEVNNDHFDIERSSDAKSWNLITTIRGNGTSTKSNKYETADKKPLNGKSYYRLKQVDLDGSYMYSRMVPVDRGLFEAVNIYPNPVKNILNISLSESVGPLNYTIIDIKGKIRYNNTVLSSNQLSVPVQNLESGLYIIQIESKTGGGHNLKFVKE